MKKRIIAVVTAILMVLSVLSACGKAPADIDNTQTAQPTAVPAEATPELPTAAPTAEPTEAPTQAPTEAPVETAPAQTNEPSGDGSVDLEQLIDDSYGAVEVEKTAITLDVLATYGDMAYFTLENSQDFTLSFRISEYLPDENHQQVGILIAPDVRNLALYGKFMRTFSGENVIEYYGTAGSWDAPEGGGRTKDPFTDSDSIYLKLTAAGGAFTFSVSRDGKEWTDMQTYNALFTDDLQIGFTGATFTTATAHAVFDEIKIEYN